jgi:nucleoside-diphosphate-sugar epimerase
MPPSCLITGATGFVGKHLARACLARGWPTRALVRPSTDSAELNQVGLSVVRGDLTDSDSLRAALEDIDVVFHCAAKVGDWGPVADYRAVNVEGLRLLLDACRQRPLQRFVHLSSLGVYEARHHYATDETEPLPSQHVDGYTQSKVESEQLALQLAREYKLPVTVLRPGFIYGPGDRTVLPKLLEALRNRRLRYLGSSARAMNTIFVGNLVDAMFLAVEKPAAIGQVFNLTDGEAVSKKRFIEALADGVGVPRPRPFPVPLWIARPLARWLERRAIRSGATEAPLLTQARIKFLGLNLDFSIEKARRELGYRPRFTFDAGMRETVAWYKLHMP